MYEWLLCRHLQQSVIGKRLYITKHWSYYGFSDIFGVALRDEGIGVCEDFVWRRR